MTHQINTVYGTSYLLILLTLPTMTTVPVSIYSRLVGVLMNNLSVGEFTQKNGTSVRIIAEPSRQGVSSRLFVS